GTGIGTTNLIFTPYIDGAAQEPYEKEITVSAPPKLDKIVFEAENDALANGRETIAEITEFIRDDGEVYTRDYEIEFISSNTDVIEVVKTDEKSCRVISKSIGSAKVIATAMAEDLTEPVVATADITVYERPLLSSIELSTEKTSVHIGDTGTVSIKSLTMTDGLPAFSAEDYEYSWENDNESAISFEKETGAFSALALGTSEIRVSALNENGKRIYGKLIISVIEKSDEPVSDKSIVVDFGKTVTEKIDGKWTVVESPGYEIITSKSNMGTWICDKCPDGTRRLRINGGATKASDIWPLKTVKAAAFNVDIPTTGYYAVFFTGGIHNRGAVYSLYAKDNYLGDYDFRGANAVDKADGGERKQLNTVYLEAGKCEFVFRGRTHYSNPYLSLEKLELIPLEITEIAPKDIVADESISLAVGEKLSDVEAYVKMSDNSLYSFGYTSSGKVNDANFFDVNASNESVSVAYSDDYAAGDTELHKFDIIGVAPGSSEIILKSFINNSDEIQKTIPITVTDEVLDSVELGISKRILFKDDTATLSAVPKLDSGRVPSVDPDVILYSSDSDVVKIEGNALTALRSGTAKVDVSITLGTVTKTDSITVTVFDGGIADMKITAGGSEYIRLGDVVPVYVTGITTDGMELDITGDEDLTYESLAPDICEVDEGGNLIPKKTGRFTLKVTELTDGGSKSFETELSVIEGKTGFTIYTEAERENARENAKKYTWAKSMAKTASEAAEEFAEMLDVLYNGLPSEGVMRSYTVGEFNDPEKYYCRYCGKNLLPEYGDPPFVIDPVSRPWKVQCPDCKRLFPSNDFGSFYELGLNEYGEFDRIRALEAHRDMLIEKGEIDTSITAPGEEYSDSWYTYYGYGNEEGFLYNDMYSELYDPTKPSCNIDPVKGDAIDGKRWGVDDGFGYMPGRSYYSNNTAGQQVRLCDERHNYIAYYLHYFYYRYYMPAITDSADAYLYTGKPEYGYTAAILLDRLADFYPSYDLSLYGTKIWASHGGLYNGKYMGSITESVEDATLISAYDAVYRLYDDDFVLNYIAEKNGKFKMRHAKKSSSQIRTNVEDGVLREMLESCTNGDIRGNFGFSQAVIAAAAVALDNGDETIEWLDFLVQPGFDRIEPVTGGGLYDWLITYLDGDGQPNEASLYNYNWLTYLLDVQSYLDDYIIKYDKVNLRTYPRFIKLLYAFMPPMLSSYNANYGDSSRKMLTNKVWMGYDSFIAGYRWTGDTDFLKALYMKYEDVTVFNEGIFVKNPERIQDEVLRVVEAEGKYNPSSETMTQFGFSVIRDGQDFRTNYGTKGQDFRRNFWMYFGYNGGHGHKDTLNLGMDAYGYNFMPDLGYPETTGTQPNRLQWISTTLSHNTVVVDEEGQVNSDKRGTPMHFDDTDIVKLMDVDAKEVYPQTDIYRRSVVMIKIDDQSSYGIDFFRIKGGDKHEYSLHTTSDEVFEISGLGTVEKQTDENGNYVGTLASP
ncbi:MAG: heparinase II/III family protein, partial [Oscillospiraceae bacterium]|nr:heparinase II/III family protein [Oscillospiraceae bacterium]